jgi:hypothetical protein
MMTYTYSEARQNFALVLERAKKDGKVNIKKRDGSLFELRPVSQTKSPLDVKGINTKITEEEIISVLREVRERDC